MPPEAIPVAIISALIGAVVGPLVLLLANKILNKPKDDTDLVAAMQKIANQAVEDLRIERQNSAARDKDRTVELEAFKERLKLVERATYGPFRITLDFSTHPLTIQNQKIELVLLKDDLPSSSS